MKLQSLLITFSLLMPLTTVKTAEFSRYQTQQVTIENLTGYPVTISYYEPDHGFGGPHKKRKRTMTLDHAIECIINPVIKKSKIVIRAKFTETRDEQLKLVRVTEKPMMYLQIVTDEENKDN